MAEITPVTLLTGFLGAGKTTLLNRLLRDPALAGAAVLINEFGETGIDHHLVEAINDSTVLLPNGCVCCSVRGDLVRALRAMLPRARRDEITRIIIETTGLADPVPILTTLLRDPAVAAAYRLASIVTVVDSVNGPRILATHEAAKRQVAVADRIALSKTDLADPAPLLPILRRLNADAPISNACGSLALLGDVPAGGMRRRFGADDAADHAVGFGTFTLTWSMPMDGRSLLAALEQLAAAHGDRLLRIKGIVYLRDQVRPFAVHAAGHLMHPPAPLRTAPDDGAIRASRLVFITSALFRQEIIGALGALGTPAPEDA
ncbi:MAG: CobW family GTP-binding protein [Rhodopila sp.]